MELDKSIIPIDIIPMDLLMPDKAKLAASIYIHNICIIYFKIYDHIILIYIYLYVIFM